MELSRRWVSVDCTLVVPMFLETLLMSIATFSMRRRPQRPALYQSDARHSS